VAADTKPSLARGYTPNELARMLRVGPDKVRAWIARGELRAVNTAAALCSRPRFVVLPEHLAEFAARRAAAPPPRPARRIKGTTMVDFYPD
jgi:Helix-turn-helix domain